MAAVLAVPSVCLADEMDVTTLLASDGASGDNYGNSVSVSGTAVVIGAPMDNDHGSDSGSAYVCRFDGTSWSQETKLTAPDGAAGDEFGVSVGLAGNIAVVGSWMDDDLGSMSGAAYVFRYSGTSWVQEAKLTAPDGAASQMFGGAVAVSGTTVVVGAMGDAQNGSYAGAGYVFVRSGGAWIFDQKLVASDGQNLDFLGCAAAIEGESIILGAYGEDDGGSLAGAAYVFGRASGTWAQESKLVAADATAGTRFGTSVGISGSAAVVGAPEEGSNGTDSGAAYVFRSSGDGWIQETKLTASDGTGFDEFGTSVAISGDRVLVGSHQHDVGLPDTGAAYLYGYDSTGWTEQTALVSPSAYYLDNFGNSVALSDECAVAGALFDDDSGNNAGSAFVFELEAPTSEPCAGDVDGSGHVDFTDVLAVLSAWGTCGGCPEDIDGNGFVEFEDVLLAFASWGNCP
ncbi:MAG: FG-GAP repeat protein [Planctomycetota bacterium]